ncbi:MAG: hypothetical protein LBP83_06970 [Dysgonamonadaceae bacterium]|jgi:hypothetical protein|nr:hypothetical protein [Dysgonamonadaceae bacterium]
MKQFIAIRRLSLVACHLSLAACLYAQNTQPDSVVLSREMILEREYNPVLKDASKINQLPEIKEPEAPKTSVEFSNYTIPYIVSPYLRTIQSNVYFSALETYKQRGYLNIGVGVPLNIEGDLGYQLLNTKKDYLSIYASHRSTRNEVTYLHNTGKQLMKINDNNAGIFYKHNFERAKFTTGVQYLNASFNYYGMTTTMDNNSTVNIYSLLNKNQVNNLLQFHTGIESNENDEINYKVNLAYNLFKQKYGRLENVEGPTESRYTANFDLSVPMNLTNAVGLQGSAKSYFYQLSEDLELPNLVYPTQHAGKYNYSIVSLNPYFTYIDNVWDIRLGANVHFQFGKTKRFLLFPNIRLNWIPLQKTQIYLNVLGGVKDNGLYNTFFENRYIDPRFRLYDSKRPFDATLGVHFLILPNLSSDIFTGYRLTEDEHFYITDYWPILSPVYMTAKTFNLGASVKYSYQDILDVSLKGIFYKWDCSGYEDYNFYLTTRIQSLYPWNQPSFTGNIESSLKIPDLPLKFNLNYQFVYGRETYVVSNQKMKDIHALSVRASYSINQMLSVYTVANNLLFQKYDIWYGYPAENFNIIGGISVKF